MANISRRKFLVSAAVLPLVAIIPLKALATTGQIHEIEGDVFINKIKINSASIIRNGDEVVVSKNGKLVFVMGEDAFLVRGGSTLRVYSEDGSVVISALRLVGGAMLGVFGKRKKTTRIFTATATIGIRGTAMYAAVSPGKLYTCTSYGHTDLIVGRARKKVVSTHHNPHIVTTGKNGKAQMKAFQMQDNNDDELRMLEALVGRKPLFNS